jgi:uncharacterized YigZ family protein
MKQDDNLPSDSYRSIALPSEGLYKDKGSRFISFSFPVCSTEEAMSKVDGVRKKFYDATHHCFAYRIGPSGDAVRANDDGEPSYSAGKPIMAEILSRDLSDVLVVVVRYFGGTKLGIPGLVKAYRSAAASALDSARTVVKTQSRQYDVSFDYGRLNDAMKSVKSLDLTVLALTTDIRCELSVLVRLNSDEQFKKEFNYATICQKA